MNEKFGSERILVANTYYLKRIAAGKHLEQVLKKKIYSNNKNILSKLI